MLVAMEDFGACYAIAVAREFFVRYLWIDLLCILQDSVDDWREESAQIGDVYRGSLCNISALHGSDSDAGCFKDYISTLRVPCIVNTA